MRGVNAGGLLEFLGMFVEVFLHVGFGGRGDVGGDLFVELADLGVRRDLFADAVEADSGALGEILERGSVRNLGSDRLEALLDFFGRHLHALFFGRVDEQGLLDQLIHHHLLDLRLDESALLGGHLLELASVAGGEKLADVEDRDGSSVDFENHVGFRNRRCGRCGPGGGSFRGGCRFRGGGRSGRRILSQAHERSETEGENKGETGQTVGGGFHGYKRKGRRRIDR